MIRHHAEAQQAQQGVADVEIAEPLGDIGTGDQGLRGGQIVALEELVVALHEMGLADRGEGLALADAGLVAARADAGASAATAPLVTIATSAESARSSAIWRTRSSSTSVSSRSPPAVSRSCRTSRSPAAGVVPSRSVSLGTAAGRGRSRVAVPHNHTMHVDVQHWLRWWGLHVTWALHDARTLAKRTVAEFFDDHCTQLAASMSYYILFSIFPLAILLVSIAGLILTDDALRERVVDALLEALPVSSGAAREDLESLIDPIAQGRSAVGLLSILGLLWGASGMMGALRFSLNTAWDHEYRRPFVRGKLVDFGLVLGVGGLLALSIGATLLLQVARNVSGDVADALGPFGPGAGGVVTVIALLAPFLLTTTTFVLVFTVVPSVRVRKRDALAGAAALGCALRAAQERVRLVSEQLLELRRGLRIGSARRSRCCSSSTSARA